MEKKYKQIIDEISNIKDDINDISKSIENIKYEVNKKMNENQKIDIYSQKIDSDDAKLLNEIGFAVTKDTSVMQAIIIINKLCKMNGIILYQGLSEFENSYSPQEKKYICYIIYKNTLIYNTHYNEGFLDFYEAQYFLLKKLWQSINNFACTPNKITNY